MLHLRFLAADTAALALAHVRRAVAVAARSAAGLAARYALPVAIVLLLLGIAGWEASTSWIESAVLSTVASHLRYRVGQDASTTIVYPRGGPFDTQRGYSLIPAFSRELEARGWQVREQVRFSPALLWLSRLGIPPPERDKPVAGLVIRDARSDTLFDAMRSRREFVAYDDIPAVVTRSLLHIENRRLGDNASPTLNPALDWGRLCKASLMWVARHAGFPVRVEGGSTLAVQLQKYRHSDAGRTHTPADKLRQIAAASLVAYRNGRDTDAARREVLLDYVNTLPLAAAPGYGEVSGLAEGLRVWFGLDPDSVVRAIDHAGTLRERAAAYAPTLALLCAAPAPSRFLRHDHGALERRMRAYTWLLEAHGILDPALARAVRHTPLAFAPAPAAPATRLAAVPKSVGTIRRHLSSILGIGSTYDLNRLDLRVQTTLDDSLQARALRLFRDLADTSFVASRGLEGEHLLSSGDPAGVTYSLLLFESAPGGDRACAHVDNLAAPFDVNSGMKLELGSTAKLRTLAHYLGVVYDLRDSLSTLDPEALARVASDARDPITRWAARTLIAEPAISADTLLDRALDRTYSASPYETFFTGSGEQTYSNFDPDDNDRILPVREALVRSTNLVFVRLMRDLERFHQARLPYAAAAALTDPDDPVRRRLLAQAAEEESRVILSRAFQRGQDLTPAERWARALGDPPAPRRAALRFYAWRPDTSVDSLQAWLAPHLPELSRDDVETLARRYGRPEFTLLDYAYLAGEHPLTLWCEGERLRDPAVTWDELWARSATPRALCERWLFDPKRFRQQNLRIKPLIERDAFEQMAVAWRALGFPFEHLVPSYATALGASGDRPSALAELMGILVSDGIRRPPVHIEQLVFAAGTPYETTLGAAPQQEERVIPVAVARTLRAAIGEVVTRGTARRLAGVFRAPDHAALPIGGKTGSGDNRFDTYGPGGRLLSSRATSRTATFVFYLGERHYGVVTASVTGPRAEDYRFTSALPLAVIRLLAPALAEHLHESGDESAAPPPSAGASASVATRDD